VKINKNFFLLIFVGIGALCSEILCHAFGHSAHVCLAAVLQDLRGWINSVASILLFWKQ